MARIGSKWTREEESQLLEELASDKKQIEIALLHERTAGGIWSRQRHMAANFYKSGVEVKDILKMCRLTQTAFNLTLKNRGLLDTPKRPASPMQGLEPLEY